MRLKSLLISLLIILTSFLTACSLFPKEESSIPPPIVEPEEFGYVTEEVTLNTIATRTSRTGYYTSLTQYNLAFEKRGGYIKELNVELKQRVRAGEVLASFDTVEIEKQVREQTLTVQSAQIDYDNAVRQVQAAADSYRRAQELADIDRKNADAKIEEKRAQFANGEITETELSVAEAEYKRTVATIKNSVTTARNAAENQADVKALVNLQQAEMKLANLKEEFDKSVIRSPIDGLITFVESIKIGSYVDARKPIVTVVDDSQLIIIVTDSEASVHFYTEFAIGTEVEVRIHRKDYKGTVMYTPSDAPINSILSTYQYILIEAYGVPKEDMEYGTSALVTLNTNVRENVIVVPASCVERYGVYSYVRVLQDGVSVERPVELGLITPASIEIINGLKVGELIILN